MLPTLRPILDRLTRRAAALVPATTAAPGDDLASLLGRPAVDLRTPELQRFLTGRRVLVTGAGGSIGSEICRQAMRFLPERLILLERSEPALFQIEQELQSRWVGSDVAAVLADVTDDARLDRVFEGERPEVVVHAAAHKHVPMMERHPGEAVKNNALGTAIVADAARRHGARSFVLVSTDKAVNPTSVMGATKRVAEMVVQEVGSRKSEGGSGRPTRRPARCDFRLPASDFRATSVRFGNVLGSSGSVVPTFARQIAAGGPVTVTHPAMRRFFMTIPEAAALVLQAGAMGRGGEVFVLDMGEPVSILSLAEAMIRRAGLVPGVDVPIRFTGVRPGEKLEEELGDGFASGAAGPMLATGHPKIRVWPLPPADPRHVARSLDALRAVVDAPADDVVDALRDAVPEYRPNREARPATRMRLVADDAPALAA